MTDIPLTNEHSGEAWKIAKALEATGLPEGTVLAILGMAMGIYMEGRDGAHREMQPLTESITKCAQISFDAIRASRGRETGHA